MQTESEDWRKYIKLIGILLTMEKGIRFVVRKEWEEEKNSPWNKFKVESQLLNDDSYCMY